MTEDPQEIIIEYPEAFPITEPLREVFTEPVWAVRRLTPVECARLQGFPDHYLNIHYRGKPAADGNRYKALGNSMAVPVMAWLGRKIMHGESAAVDARGKEREIEHP